MKAGCPFSLSYNQHSTRLSLPQQFLSRALVRVLGIVFRFYYKSIAESAGKDFRYGAVLPLE